MSRTKRSFQILACNWSYKSHTWKEFRASYAYCHEPDDFGYKQRSRHNSSALLSAWDDKTPAAAREVKYYSQTNGK
jgi:hypothetical protein